MMNPAQIEVGCLTPVPITRHFNPAWFTSGIGTAEVP